VTRRCDEKCSYCWTAKNYNPSKDLSTSESKEVVNMFKGFGAWYFAIFGGEPTLRADLPEIIKHAKDFGMFSVLHTNGSFANASV
jgi:pyrroloquinoline quinone biosynthesis protein E